jgi:hypothetical protein
MSPELARLYESTAEDLLFGMGSLRLPNVGLVPLIHVHYPLWSRDELEPVRQSFYGGLILVSGRRSGQLLDIYIATKERIVLQAQKDGQTDVLRGPAWDARLASVTETVFAQFNAQRQRYGGFLLLVQTPAWEFLSAVDERNDRTHVGSILPQSLPIPSGQIAN